MLTWCMVFGKSHSTSGTVFGKNHWTSGNSHKFQRVVSFWKRKWL